MIGQHDELVAVLSIPTNDVIRSRVTVAVQRMGVGIALEPRCGRSNRCGLLRGNVSAGECHGENSRQPEACLKCLLRWFMVDAATS